ncbi:MAG: hypothetical protein RJA81_260 [Planctomycetota bacterium]|jgi:hypothetical protein
MRSEIMCSEWIDENINMFSNQNALEILLLRRMLRYRPSRRSRTIHQNRPLNCQIQMDFTSRVGRSRSRIARNRIIRSDRYRSGINDAYIVFRLLQGTLVQEESSMISRNRWYPKSAVSGSVCIPSKIPEMPMNKPATLYLLDQSGNLVRNDDKPSVMMWI